MSGRTAKAARRTITCASCGQTSDHAGRGLCKICWRAASTDGTLADHPLACRPGTETVQDVEALLAAGESPEQILARLGTTPGAVVAALRRAGHPAARRFYAIETRARRARKAAAAISPRITDTQETIR